MTTPFDIHATARWARVYGSTHVYGEERTDPIGKPLVAPDFPAAGDQGLVWLGAVPSWLPEARWRREAIRPARLRTAFGFADGKSMNELIQEQLDTLQRPSFEDRAWYVTVAVEREVGLRQPQSGGPEQHEWLEIEDADKLADEFRAEFAAPLNVLAATVESRLGIPGLFEQVVLEDELYFFAPDRPPLSIPQLNFQARPISIKMSGTAATLADLEQRVAELGAEWPNAMQLSRPLHWYLAAMRSRDPWNRFLWAFLALEILTNKLAPRYRTRVLETFSFESGDDAEGVAGTALGSLVPQQERLSLAGKFAILALGLSPSTAKSDMTVFASVTKARHELAHGQITDPAELPDSGALDLARRYLNHALQAR